MITPFEELVLTILGLFAYAWQVITILEDYLWSKKR